MFEKYFFQQSVLDFDFYFSNIVLELILFLSI